jgi:uncharacterized protein YndB with AHSA1/START domain
MTQNVITSVEIKLQVEISASKEKVWNAIILDTSSWWLRDFYYYENSKIILEPFPGGRLYEDGGENGGGIWYNVLNINPKNSIQFTGNLSPQFGGPAATYLNLSLKEEKEKTILTVIDSLIGVLQPGTEKQIEQGWKMLFEKGLKTYLEN